MTMEAKCKMIDDMIRENPDATIKDYLEILKDVEDIERTVEREPTKLVKYQGRNSSGKFTKVYWLPSY